VWAVDIKGLWFVCHRKQVRDGKKGRVKPNKKSGGGWGNTRVLLFGVQDWAKFTFEEAGSWLYLCNVQGFSVEGGGQWGERGGGIGIHGRAGRGDVMILGTSWNAIKKTER